MQSIPHISKYDLIGDQLILKESFASLAMRKLNRIFLSATASIFILIPSQGLTGCQRPETPSIKPQTAVKYAWAEEASYNEPLPPPKKVVSSVRVEEKSFVTKASDYMKSVNATLTDVEAKSFASYILSSAKDTALDARLLLALLKVESTFNPKAVSKHGAKGLGQIVPKYHMEKILLTSDKYFNGDNIFHPGLNISVAAQVLRENLDSSKTLAVALLKYNGSVTDSTQKYAKTVLAEYSKLKSLI